MFKSAVIRLTLGYVGAITLICLMFSIPVYNVTSGRLRSGAERQAEYIGRAYRSGQTPVYLPELAKIRERQLADDRRQLLSGLVIINLCIITVGGYLSYLFAKQTLKPIKEAHNLQKAFTANASHELRTPLAVIQAESEVALRDKKLSLSKAKSTISSNLEEVSRLQRITSQLLSLTRIEPGIVGFKAVDLVKLTKSEVKLYQRVNKIKIQIDSPALMIVMADETLLRQAIGTLLDNAIKYSEADKRSAIKVLLKTTRQLAILRVEDQGIGISKTDQSRVFDRFYRGKNSGGSSRDLSGNGLGLAIAKQIIEQHHGEIYLEKSVAGKGSVFGIKLPLVK